MIIGIFTLAWFVCLFALPSEAHGKRIIHGCIQDASGTPLKGFQVRAYDRDAFGESDSIIGSDTDDFMGKDITDNKGCFRIAYSRPNRFPGYPGHWDWSVNHNDTRWRPDIYIQIDIPTAGFCEPNAFNAPRWRSGEESSVVTNHRTKIDLRLNHKMKELFDTSCGILKPFIPLMKSQGVKLRGLVDMHAHPMAHLGFGGKIFHGAPDIGSLMVSGTYYCNPDRFRTTSLKNTLPVCYSTHGGKDFISNTCGDYIRHEIIKGVEQSGLGIGEVPSGDHGPHCSGFPYFNSWPAYNDITHQQMWVDWIYRAYRGGLRVMVALSVNSKTLAVAANGEYPLDDKGSANRQIEETKQFVKRHAFMEIATTPRELRQIVGNNKLAVVLGVELDDLGNFNSDNQISENKVRNEIRRLYQSGVRYIFPVHLINNVFGGTSFYESTFAVANRYQYGKWWDIKCSSTDIDYKYESSDSIFFKAALWARLGIAPTEYQRVPQPDCLNGHMNPKGLTHLGTVAIKEMQRLGMMIDIDHMSQKTAEDVLTLAKQNSYPVNSGHNSIRPANGTDASEHQRIIDHYQTIQMLGGMAGVGWSGTDATGFLKSLNEVSTAMSGVNIALGTDANGLSPMPSPPLHNPISYSSDFPMARTGMRKWNYNVKGVAHYGLMPDFFADIKQQPTGNDMLNQLFQGAEGFAKMWETCEFIRDEGGLPDLMIESIKLTPSKPNKNQTFTVSVRVRNIGKTIANSSIMTLQIGGETYPPEYKVPSLTGGSSHIVVRTSQLGVVQRYRTTAHVDVKNQIDEGDEVNNIKWLNFDVYD